MSNKPRISIIIPTYNRARYLDKMLDTVVNQSIEPTNYEIIVVDNNSSDDTKQVVENYNNPSNPEIRYHLEEKQGSHHARNSGIKIARGDILVFGDDDVVVGESWVMNYLKEFDNNPNTGIAGGKVVPLWESEPPEWVHAFEQEKYHLVFAYFDYGNERKKIYLRNLFGCNFAIRRDLAFRTGGNHPDVYGPDKYYLAGVGENWFFEQTRKFGYDVIYLPNVEVSHHVKESRVSLNYFLYRYKTFAVESAYNFYLRSPKYMVTPYLILISTYGIIVALLHVVRELIKFILQITKHPGFVFKEVCTIYYNMHRIIQTIRVLLNKNLYRHIIRKRYLPAKP